MGRLIDADEITLQLSNPLTQEDIDLITDVNMERTTKVWFRTPNGNEVEFVKVVRCKDCKHKPTRTGVNHDIEFPDDVCPCQCEDYWYSWMPQDDFFCKFGRRKTDEES